MKVLKFVVIKKLQILPIVNAPHLSAYLLVVRQEERGKRKNNY